MQTGRRNLPYVEEKDQMKIDMDISGDYIKEILSEGAGLQRFITVKEDCTE